MKYSRGSYQVILFGEYGDKLEKISEECFHKARTIADEHMALAKENSAVINRTIWNSKDNDNKWDYVQ